MENGSADISRRSFLTRSTAAGAVVTAFTIIRPELVRGAGDERLKAGLVGCGGRGTEAAQQFLHGNENVELVAMGDIFEDHLEKSLGEIRGSKYTGVAEKVKVDPDHHFIGFDAYKKVLASDVDVVLLATPPGYRPEHFVAAVEAKKTHLRREALRYRSGGRAQGHGGFEESRRTEIDRRVGSAAPPSGWLCGDLEEGARRRDRRHRGYLCVLG